MKKFFISKLEKSTFYVNFFSLYIFNKEIPFVL